jgi:cytochrome P450
MASALPPGRLGLPWIGESVDYFRDPFTFLRSRHERYGPVFRTRLAGRTVYCFAGPDAIAFFYDRRYFTREKANPVQVEQLAYPDAIIGLDQTPRHAARREQVLAFYTREARESFIPAIDRTVCGYLRRWERLGTFAWLPELKTLSVDLLTALLGEPDREPGGERPLVGLVERMAFATFGFPINLPITRYGRGIAARNEVRAYIASRLADGSDREGTIIRYARAARSAHGIGMTQDELELELHHFLFGSFQTLTGAFAGVVTRLGDHPDVAARVAQEAGDLVPGQTLSRTDLAARPYLLQVANEVRRTTPLICHTFFARAKTECEFAGFRVPEGVLATASLHATLHDPTLFPKPDEFDPDRFGPSRGEGARENTFVAHGGGPWNGHRCPGEGLADLMLQIFTLRVAGGYGWKLAPQTRALDMRTPVPLPVSGIPVRFHRA